MSLFDNKNREVVEGIYYYPDWIQNSLYYEDLKAKTEWKQEYAKFSTTSVPLPRLTAWYGDRKYKYSGIENNPTPWSKNLTLWEIREQVESFVGEEFNSVLLNYYRSGKDHVSWHSDSERTLDPSSQIVSVSFGCDRIFELKNKTNPKNTIKLNLRGGSLLIMQSGIQEKWLHRISKSDTNEQRINLTFRNCI